MAVIAHPPLSGLDPLRGLARRLRLARKDREEFLRIIALVVLVLWGPLVALGAAEWLLRRQVDPVVTDVAVHARLLIALPLYLMAGQVLERMLARVFDRLSSGEQMADPAALAPISRSAARWGRARTMEVLLVLVAFVLAREVVHGEVARSGLVPGTLDAPGTGPAAAWYGHVALPMFLFLSFRVLWRWLVWSAALWRISRLPLTTDPTHPDGAGGLAFLARPTDALALMTFGTSATTACSWAPRLLAREADPAQLALVFTTFLLVPFSLAIVPMVPVLPRLVRTFRNGLWQFDRLSLTYGRRFSDRWIRQPPGPELLGAPDIQSLADLGNAYRDIVRMRYLPFGRLQVTELLGAALLPMIPLVLTQIPLAKLLPAIAKALIG